MRPLLSLTLLAALTLGPAALALAQDPGDDVGTPPGSLFISPSGEPFRAKAGEPYPVAVWFALADANHDGHLDRDEFMADAMRFFARLDVNQNSRIDSDELSYYEHRVVPEILAGQHMGALDGGWMFKAAYLDQGMGGMGGGGMGGMGGGGGGRPGGGSGGFGGTTGEDAPQSRPQVPMSHNMDGAAPYGLLGEPEPVAASDYSFTGSISLADFKRRTNSRFDRLDPSKRGYLELTSLPRTMAQTLMDGSGGKGGKRRGPPRDRND
jgi:hypothetical protein